MKCNSALQSVKAEDLVEMATNYNKGSTKNNAFIEKIFENIDKEQE